MGPGIGATNESLSYDGRWFAYWAGNPYRVELIDRQRGETWQVSAANETALDPPSISPDGTRVVYGSGPGNTRRAVIGDRVRQATIATFYVGDAVRGALSADGHFLAFATRDQTLTVPPPDPYGGIVVVNVDKGDAWQASVSSAGIAADDYSGAPDISKDGQRVVFQSVAMNLVPGKPSRRWDVYLHDRQTHATTLVCHAPAGGYGNDRSYTVRISGDGQTVVFDSMASDLVPGDTEGTNDLFVLETNTGEVTSLSLGRTTGENSVSLVDVTSDGRFVVFGASSDGYVEEDQNRHADAIIYDRATGNYELASRGYDGAPLSLGAAPVAVSGDGNWVAFMTNSPELGGSPEVAVLCFAERAALAH
jgi:Tol biopolymer transport system component